MCQGICKEKCIACGERGYSCCTNTLPMFTAEELARLHYNTDYINIDQIVNILTVSFLNKKKE